MRFFATVQAEDAVDLPTIPTKTEASYSSLPFCEPSEYGSGDPFHEFDADSASR
jgi:hypothetical protein